MPSPFPGMDPYLEHPFTFPGLHSRLIVGIGEALQPALPAPYFAEIEERVWVEVSQRFIEPDASVFRREVPPGRAGAETRTRSRPVVVTVPHDERHERWIEIRVRGDEGERLVTAIEVLSPSNKTPGETCSRSLPAQAARAARQPGPPGRDRLAEGRPAHDRRAAGPALGGGRPVRLSRLGPPIGSVRGLLRLSVPPGRRAPRDRHPALARRWGGGARPPGGVRPGLRRRPVSPPHPLRRGRARPPAPPRGSGVGRRPHPRRDIVGRSEPSPGKPSGSRGGDNKIGIGKSNSW